VTIVRGNFWDSPATLAALGEPIDLIHIDIANTANEFDFAVSVSLMQCV
jgi:hypothetical protein